MVGPQEAKNTAVLPVCDKNLICVLSRILLCFESNSKDCRTGSQGVVVFFIFYLLFFFSFFLQKDQKGVGVVWVASALVSRLASQRGGRPHTVCTETAHSVHTDSALCAVYCRIQPPVCTQRLT